MRRKPLLATVQFLAFPIGHRELRGGLNSEALFESCLGGLAAFPGDQAAAVADFAFLEHPYEVAIADARSVEAVSGIQAHVAVSRLSPKGETAESVDGVMPRAVQALLIGEQYEPMRPLKTGRLGLPYFPLAQFHRSGRWRTALA